MDEVKIGDAVIFVDPLGRDRPALVTAVWGDPKGTPAVNVVFVEDDANRHDAYGRQIARETSVVYEASQPAHGNYWRR